MSVVELMEELHRRRVRLSLDSDRLLVTPPPAGLPADLVAVIDKYKIDLAWAAVGAQTGHCWAACGSCGQPALVKLSIERPSVACRLTHGCSGRLRPYRATSTSRDEQLPGTSSTGLPIAIPGRRGADT